MEFCCVLLPSPLLTSTSDLCFVCSQKEAPKTEKRSKPAAGGPKKRNGSASQVFSSNLKLSLCHLK